VGETVSEDDIIALVAEGRLDEAVERAMEYATSLVTEELLGVRGSDALSPFVDRWLPSLPPLERLAAAAPLAEADQLLKCHAAAALSFAAELRDFWSFTDSPDSEVAPAIMDRFRQYSDQVESMSFDPEVPRREPPPADRWEPSSPFDDPPPFEPLPVLPAAENQLMSLIADGHQAEAVRLALEHRDLWVKTRLDEDAVEANDLASSAFLQAWLPALPPLERLQAASWASSNFQLALVHLPHAYGIGARLLLEALAAAATRWAGLLRDLASLVDTRGSRDQAFSGRLHSYADQLDAMSFEPIPLDPED
jgi:hypothetical protein